MNPIRESYRTRGKQLRIRSSNKITIKAMNLIFPLIIKLVIILMTITIPYSLKKR